MNYIAVIEMGKGETRRIHLKYDGSGFIDLGPIKDQIPVNEGIMPINYGYLENTLNPIEKDDVDVVIFSNKLYKTGDKVEVEIIGMFNREDGDHKVLAVDDSMKIESFEDILPTERESLLDFFGYKSKIVSISTKDEALEYLASCKV